MNWRSILSASLKTEHIFKSSLKIENSVEEGTTISEIVYFVKKKSTLPDKNYWTECSMYVIVGYLEPGDL